MGMLQQWNTILGRGAKRSAMEALMRQDIGGGNGWGARQVEDLLSTPVTLQGLGWKAGDPSRWLRAEEGRVVKQTMLRGVMGITNELLQWKAFGMRLDPTAVAIALADNVETPNARQELIPAQLQPVNFRHHGRLSLRNPVVSGIPLSAPVNPLLPKTLANVARDQAVREKRDNWLHNVYVDPPFASVSKRMKDNMGRRNWLDWVRGTGPWRTPVIPGISDLMTSIWSKRFQEAQWTHLVGRRRVSRIAIVQAALSAEHLTIEATLKEPIRFGG
jgi:hypothetical protein